MIRAKSLAASGIKQRTVDLIGVSVEFEPNSGCWLWSGPLAANGYGRAAQGILAHRASYALHKGDIPENTLVRHRCDTPLCINPDHLILGTAKDNAADRVLRRRGSSKGDKLNEHTVRAIAVDPRPYARVAQKYGVHKSTVDKIKRGDTWGHLHIRRVRRSNRSLTRQDAEAIRSDCRTAIKIAEQYGISPAYVYHIRAGHRWRVI